MKRELKDQIITVRLTKSQVDELQKLAESGKCFRKTLSSALSFLVKQHIEKK